MIMIAVTKEQTIVREVSTFVWSKDKHTVDGVTGGAFFSLDLGAEDAMVTFVQNGIAIHAINITAEVK